MWKKLLIWGVGLILSIALSFYLLTLPLLRRLPRPGRVALDGITTIDQAVADCRRSGLAGWELVGYAQHLAARKFSYSRLNACDSPARAFERGLGYCQQQALALKQIYNRLGIEARPVYAQRCRFPAKIVDGMPQPPIVSAHTWLRVRLDNEERDVCCGSVANTPGKFHFEIISPVKELPVYLWPFSHLGSVITNVQRDKQARRQSSTSLGLVSKNSFQR